MKPIRILHVVNTMNYAGIETFLMELYRNINREKIQFDFLIHNNVENDFENEIKRLGGKIHRIEKYQVLGINKYKDNLLSFFKSHQEYRIVHSHINTFSKYVLMAAKKAGIQFTIAHSHASKPPFSIKTILKSLTKLNISKYADYKFACSTNAAQWLFNSKDDFIYLKNSINIEKFGFNEKNRMKKRKELNLNDKTLVLGHVGGFRKGKNQEFVIDIFKELMQYNEQVHLLFIGDGPLYTKVKAKVKSYKLNENVTFIGQTNRVEDYMLAMDVFIFPSEFEGLGIVTIEAQASGLNSLVSTRVPSETNITPVIKYFPLEKSSLQWAKELINLDINSSIYRSEMKELVKKKGFGIKENADWLQKFYLELV